GSPAYHPAAGDCSPPGQNRCCETHSKMAAQLLIDQGHQVVLHARNTERAQETLASLIRVCVLLAQAIWIFNTAMRYVQIHIQPLGPLSAARGKKAGRK